MRSTTTPLAGFYREFDDQFDRLDVLVNVVGGVVQRHFADSTPEQWALDIERNYGYALHSTSHAIPRIRAGGRGGSIIGFTTIEAHRGAAGFAVYAGAKAGLTNFSRALALELGPERIRVNLVAPDTTPSEGSMRAVPFASAPSAAPTSPEFIGKAMAAYIPLGAPPAQAELGDAVLFLASDLSSSVTGTTLHVDGGTWAASGFQHWPGPQGWLPVVPFGLLRPDAFE